MSKENVGLFALEAEGCVYGEDYYLLLYALANRYYDFFKRAAEWPRPLNGVDKVFINRQRANINAGMREIVKKLPDFYLDEIQFDGSFAERIVNLSQVEKILTQLPPSGTLDLSQIHDLEEEEEQLFYDAKGLALSEFINYVQIVCPDIYNQLLINSNEKLIKFICDTSIESKHTHIQIASGSNRGSFEREYECRQLLGTGWFILDIETLKNEVERRLSKHNIKVTLNSFMLANNAPGSTPEFSAAELIKKTVYEGLEFEHATCINDDAKIIPLYALVNNSMTLLGDEAKYTLHVLDDQIVVLNHQLQLLKFVPHFFPELKYCGYKCNRKSTPIRVYDVVTTGKIDRFYAENTQWMVDQCSLKQRFNFNSVIDLNVPNFLKFRARNEIVTSQNPVTLYGASAGLKRESSKAELLKTPEPEAKRSQLTI